MEGRFSICSWVEHQFPWTADAKLEPKYPWLIPGEVLLSGQAAPRPLRPGRAPLLVVYAKGAPRSRLRWLARGGREYLVVPLPAHFELP